MPAPQSWLAAGPLRSAFSAAGRFWEPRRIVYNLILGAIALTWFVATWPHFRAVLNVADLLRLLVLAALANVCYSAAYFVDVPLQHFSPPRALYRVRWGLWAAGMALAILVTNYWIADEIYPYVR